MQGSDFWLSMSELLTRLAAGVSTFIDREIELAKLEASEDVSALVKATQICAVAAVLAIGALAMLLTAAVSAMTATYVAMGVDANIASSLAALSIAVVCGVAAWWLFAHASSIMRTVAKRLDRALSILGTTAKRNPDALPPAEDKAG
jgi:hypothetical protein